MGRGKIVREATEGLVRSARGHLGPPGHIRTHPDLDPAGSRPKPAFRRPAVGLIWPDLASGPAVALSDHSSACCGLIRPQRGPDVALLVPGHSTACCGFTRLHHCLLWPYQATEVRGRTPGGWTPGGRQAVRESLWPRVSTHTHAHPKLLPRRCGGLQTYGRSKNQSGTILKQLSA